MTNSISKYKRIPLIIAFQETSQYKDTYAGEIGTVALTAHLLKPENSEGKSVVVFMHPTEAEVICLCSIHWLNKTSIQFGVIVDTEALTLH